MIISEGMWSKIKAAMGDSTLKNRGKLSPIGPREMAKNMKSFSDFLDANHTAQQELNRTQRSKIIGKSIHNRLNRRLKGS